MGLLIPDVLEVLAERVNRLAVFVGGGIICGSAGVDVGFDGVHFVFRLVSVSLSGNTRTIRDPRIKSTFILRDSRFFPNVQFRPRTRS